LAHHSQWKFEETAVLSKENKDWLEADLNEDGHVSKW